MYCRHDRVHAVKSFFSYSLFLHIFVNLKPQMNCLIFILFLHSYISPSLVLMMRLNILPPESVFFFSLPFSVYPSPSRPAMSVSVLQTLMMGRCMCGSVQSVCVQDMSRLKGWQWAVHLQCSQAHEEVLLWSTGNSHTLHSVQKHVAAHRGAEEECKSSLAWLILLLTPVAYTHNYRRRLGVTCF